MKESASAKEIESVETVSYTHLDVYKRQPVIFICGTVGIDKFIDVCLKTKEKIKCGLK